MPPSSFLLFPFLSSTSPCAHHSSCSFLRTSNSSSSERQGSDRLGDNCRPPNWAVNRVVCIRPEMLKITAVIQSLFFASLSLSMMHHRLGFASQSTSSSLEKHYRSYRMAYNLLSGEMTRCPQCGRCVPQKVGTVIQNSKSVLYGSWLRRQRCRTRGLMKQVLCIAAVTFRVISLMLYSPLPRNEEKILNAD